MPSSSKSLLRVRVAGYLLPPLGLWMLWRHPQSSLARKLFGTLGLVLYSAIYAAGIVSMLIVFAGLQIEWRGGFPPVLTFHKTIPDFEAVETHRASQAAGPEKTPEPEKISTSYWTGFRGPQRDGHYTEQPIRTDWPREGLPLLWKQPCGAGYASFAVAEGLAFTIEQRREHEVVVAYDTQTGHEVWAHRYTARFDEPLGGEGPRATPTWDDGRLYSLGAMGDLICFEAKSGRVLWEKNILRDNQAPELTYGMAASPLVVAEKLIVCPGGPRGKSVVAYHKLNGERLWSALDDPAAYSSPMLVDLADQQQLLVVTDERAVGLTPGEGKLLWEFPWVVQHGNRNIAQPVQFAENRFMLSAGYGTGCAAVEVVKKSFSHTALELWRNRNLKNKFTSSVHWKSHIYGLDEDILVCLDVKTGERKWKDGRYGYGQLVLAEGHLIILTGDGQLALVKATPESHQELARFQAIQGKTWNHPAVANGKLIVRNLVEMACFDLSVK